MKIADFLTRDGSCQQCAPSVDLTAVDNLSVNDGYECLTADCGKRIGCPDYYIGVFADFQTANPIFYTQNSGGIDGDCLPRFCPVKTGIYSKTCTHGQIMKRDFRSICYDADEAGQWATARAIGILRPLGINIKILTVPNGKDPDEFMKSHGEQGPARFRMLLNNSGNDIDYRLTKLRSGYHLDITQQRVEFLTKACELLSQLDNSIERDIYISKLAEELGVEKAAIKEQTQQSIRTRQYRTEKDRQRSIQRSLTVPPEGFSGTEPFNLRVASAEDALISLLMEHPDVAVSIFPTLSPTLFPTAFHRMIYELLRDRAAQGYNFTFTDISDKLSADERNRLGKLLMSHSYEENPTAAAKDYIDILQEESEKLSPQQIAEADDNTLLEEMRKLRSKKQ